MDSKNENVLLIMIFLVLIIYNKKKLIKTQRPVNRPAEARVSYILQDGKGFTQ